jgi:ATPase subunit of ABC transporter with duplicated ATPase domains
LFFTTQVLVEGIRAFPGGVVMVSHDRRLFEATDCRLVTVQVIASPFGVLW